MASPTAESHWCEKILLVDDVSSNLAVLTTALEPAGYEIMVASSGPAAIKVASRGQPHLILLDIIMPDMDGFETCRRLKQEETTRDIPVIFITALGDTSHVVEGFHAGGVDYIAKPFQTEEVLSRVATHLGISRLTHQLQEKNRALEARTAELMAEIERRQLAETALLHADNKLAAFSDLEASRGNIEGLIGGSGSIRGIIGEIRRLHAFPHTSVLITGESGTGKELIARAIHFGSPRSKSPFVPVNCVAIPVDLAESILFGHVKGAFTGATGDRKGCFEMASGGTLFLDEIGDMPAALQVKLLRVLEDGCVMPVGGSTPVKVDVRVIAATNADLDARIADGTFRQDLYFRLARYTVASPPLRERADDVPLLAAHFLRVFAGEMNVPEPPLTREAVTALRKYRFPGNVRELKNIIERALIGSGGQAIQPEHLQLHGPVPSPAAASFAPSIEVAESLPLNLAQAEDVLIQRALQETGGNIAEAARMLGVHRTRIYRKLAQEEAGATG